MKLEEKILDRNRREIKADYWCDFTVQLADDATEIIAANKLSAFEHDALKSKPLNSWG